MNRKVVSTNLNHLELLKSDDVSWPEYVSENVGKPMLRGLTFNDILRNHTSFIEKTSKLELKTKFDIFLDSLEIIFSGSAFNLTVHNYVVKEMMELLEENANNQDFVEHSINNSLKYIKEPQAKGDIWAGIITLAVMPLTIDNEHYDHILAVHNFLLCRLSKIDGQRSRVVVTKPFLALIEGKDC